MKKHSRKVPVSEVKITLQKCRDIYQLTDRQEKGIRQLIAQGRLTNAIYQQLNNIPLPGICRNFADRELSPANPKGPEPATGWFLYQIRKKMMIRKKKSSLSDRLTNRYNGFITAEYWLK